MTDPVKLTRATAALDAAWDEIRLTLSDPYDERERTRLAYIIAGLASVAEDEDELALLAIERFRRAQAS